MKDLSTPIQSKAHSKAVEVVERHRLTLVEYRAIYAIAEPWLKVAIDLGIQTLQRCEDLLKMKYADIKDGHLYTEITKDNMRSEISHLRIKLNTKVCFSQRS